jgi:hypothetical protein
LQPERDGRVRAHGEAAGSFYLLPFFSLNSSKSFSQAFISAALTQIVTVVVVGVGAMWTCQSVQLKGNRLRIVANIFSSSLPLLKLQFTLNCLRSK